MLNSSVFDWAKPQFNIRAQALTGPDAGLAWIGARFEFYGNIKERNNGSQDDSDKNKNPYPAPIHLDETSVVDEPYVIDEPSVDDEPSVVDEASVREELFEVILVIIVT